MKALLYGGFLICQNINNHVIIYKNQRKNFDLCFNSKVRVQISALYFLTTFLTTKKASS